MRACSLPSEPAPMTDTRRLGEAGEAGVALMIGTTGLCHCGVGQANANCGEFGG
jgi:hypothetical protein